MLEIKNKKIHCWIDDFNGEVMIKMAWNWLANPKGMSQSNC